MRNLTNVLLVLVAISANDVLCQSSKQEQQPPPTAQTPPPEAQGQAAYKSVTGCVVQTNQGFFLKTDTNSYSIETDEDLSPYVNKQVNLTGIVEHQNGDAPSAESGSTAVIRDVRMRMIARVLGDCIQPSQ